MIWRVNRESVVALAGSCAILMQFAHPAVAAGVRDHSNFQEDPTGRLRRTMDLTMTMVFAPRSAAIEAVRTVNRRHRAVRGPGYSAMDPELLMWVQSTLVYSAVTAYRAFVAPLSTAEADQYYQDTKEIGVLLGIKRQQYPKDLDAFQFYLDTMIDRGAVSVGEAARRMAAVVLRPDFPGVPRMAFAPLSLITAGLLPPRLREDYRFKWGRLERAAFEACRVGLRRLVAVTPTPIRLLPPARRAYERLRAA
jgi:uncharacterized protein (DUF2236 family)